MLKIEVSKLLPPLTDPEHIHRFFVLLLALAATLAFWLESTGTPAMICQEPSPARTPAVASIEPVTSPLSSVTAPRLRFRTSVIKPDNQDATGYSYDYRFEKQNDSNQRDLFQLIHKKLSANGQSGSRVLVEAGYGQICEVEAGIGENEVELERPSRAYLKASFSF